MEKKIDYTLYAPVPIIEVGRDFENNPRVKFEKGYIASLDDSRFFVHARATLPLKDIDNGIGFGLWIEVSKEDYEAYLATENDDEAYKGYSADGVLAHEWPGFLDSMGLKVRVRTIRVNEKIYVTEVLDAPEDIALKVALLMQADDQKQKSLVENMVRAYYLDMGVEV